MEYQQNKILATILCLSTLLYCSHGLSEFTSVDVYKTVEMVDDTVAPNIIRFNVTVTQWNITHSSTVNITLQDGDGDLKVYWGDEFVGPSRSDPNFQIINDKVMKWRYNDFTQTSEMHLSYKAQYKNDGKGIELGEHYYNATASYVLSSDNATFPEPAEVVEGPCCLDVISRPVGSLFTDYGFTVLALVCGLIVGAAIVVLILFILTKVRQKTPFTDQVHPYNSSDRVESGNARSSYNAKNGELNMHTTLTNTKAAFSTAYDRCRGIGQKMADGSIVFLLSLHDKLAMVRRMDDDDINQTMKLEQDLEKERSAAMVNGTTMLVDSMRKNGDVDKGVADKCASDMDKKIKEMEKKGDQTLRTDLEGMLKNLNVKHKGKIAQLQEKQDDDVLKTRAETSKLLPVEQREVMDLLEKQHSTEMDELLYTLKLEQDENIEQIRTEHAIKNRMRLKEIQKEYLKDIDSDGKLSPEHLDWLMAEYYKQQLEIDKLYDEEKARARMVLEEKIARRRALAEKHEESEEGDGEILNTIAMQQLGLVQSAKKGGILSPSEAKAISKEYQQQMIAVKEKMDAEKERQRNELNKKLSERKKKQMEELAKKQQQEMNDLAKKNATQRADASCDPMEIIESKLAMISQHRSEMADLENELDMEHTDELTTLDETLNNKTKDELLIEKDRLGTRLEREGLSDAKLQKILKQHDAELQDLEAQIEQDKAKQMKNFKKKLAQNRAAMAEQREQDKTDQNQLREHEENIVRKLVENQVSLSEEERNKIMKEHEMLMAKLDNGLTLSKIKQKKLLEDKIAKRRNQQMEKLQKKQNIELKKKQRSTADSEDEEHAADLDLLKKQAEERIKIMQGEDLEVENELAEIQDALMSERANAMRDQEVKLAAMIAELQLEKANQMAKIDEQERALNSLAVNLMDDLNEKGTLDPRECQQMIQMHQENQEKLQDKLDSQRAKQEKQLKRRLQDRLQQKEEQITRMHEAEMKSAGPGHSFGAKFRKAAMMTRHLVEMEKFRNQIEKEISQSLEELRRQNDLKRKQVLQEQELLFLNGLVRLGRFNKAELQNVVQMLLPTKSEEELKDIMEKILEGYKEPEKDRNNPQPAEGNTTLEDRVLATTLSQVS